MIFLTFCSAEKKFYKKCESHLYKSQKEKGRAHIIHISTTPVSKMTLKLPEDHILEKQNPIWCIASRSISHFSITSSHSLKDMQYSPHSENKMLLFIDPLCRHISIHWGKNFPFGYMSTQMYQTELSNLTKLVLASS